MCLRVFVGLIFNAIIHLKKSLIAGKEACLVTQGSVNI